MVNENGELNRYENRASRMRTLNRTESSLQQQPYQLKTSQTETA